MKDVRIDRSVLSGVIVRVVTAGVCVVYLIRAAANNVVSFETESGVLSGPVAIADDPQASGGQFVSLNTTEPAPPTDPWAFQPTAPFHATFFYLWHLNPNTDGKWSYWSGQGNGPPTKWFAHYLPDPDPSRFDPANELYSNNNYDIFKWQMGEMAQARQEVAIGSWFGRDTKQDRALSTILNDFMTRSDNPYPNLRWALYYECEGITTAQSPSCPSSTADPSLDQIISDLNYIHSDLGARNSPFFLRIGGKPVIFVFGATEGLATSQKWKEANAAMGNPFYIVLKVYSGWRDDPNQPDAWHQYGPSSREGKHLPHSYYVSPGFWRDGKEADGVTPNPVRLCRNLDGPAQTKCMISSPGTAVPSFKTAVQNMVNSSATWKLVQTWNEWGEGTSVEPGNQTIINASGQEVDDPAGATFENRYVETLGELLPPLEAGTGAVGGAP